eukprot:UN06614
MSHYSGYKGADAGNVSYGTTAPTKSHPNYIAHAGVSYCGTCSCGKYVSCKMGTRTLRPAEEEYTSSVESPCCNYKFVIAEILLYRTTCEVEWQYNVKWAQDKGKSTSRQKQTYSPTGDDFVRLGGKDKYGQTIW